MASEIRVNKINNRAGLGTITIADTGVVVNGIVTCTEVSGLNVLNIAGVSTFASTLDINGDIDVDGHTNLDNLSIAGVTTFTNDVYFDGATAGRDIVFDRSDNQLEFAQNAKAYFGGAYPLTIYNNINSYISQNPNAALFIESKDVQIYGSGNGYNDAIFIARNGIVELGYEPSGGSLSTQLKTSAKGITVGTGVTIETNGQATFTGIVTASTYYGDGSNLSNITSTTINNYASTRIVTATNNANELDAETNLTVNGSLITFADSTLVVNKGTNPTVTVTETAGSKSGQFRANTDGALLRSLGNYPLIFHTNQVERAQIDGTGRFLIGTNSVYNANSYSNNLVIYENGDTGASIIGNNSNSNYSSLYFSDTSTASRAFLEVQLGANGNFTIGTNGSGPIRLTNSGGERLRIDGNGRLLLGTTTEGHENADNFTISESGTAGMTIRSTSSNCHIYFSDATSGAGEYVGQLGYNHGSDYMFFHTGGSERFRANSSGITVTGTVDSASDVILKENIKTIDNALEKVTKLRGVEYDYKENKKHSIGVIAQEVEEVLPELVNGSEQKSVAYGNIAAVLIEAIKEQNELINKMKKEIEDLKG